MKRFDSSDERDLLETGYDPEATDGAQIEEEPIDCCTVAGVVAVANTVQYGPETFEDYKKRLNSAANALRPNQPRKLTYSEQSRVDSLVATMGYGDPEAIRQIGLNDKEVYGDQEFDFTNTDDLRIVEKIVDATYASKIKHLAHELTIENNDRHKKGEPYRQPTEIDELIRLRDYKLTHLQTKK